MLPEFFGGRDMVKVQRTVAYIVCGIASALAIAILIYLVVGM